MTLLMDNMCIVNITAELCILPKKSQRLFLVIALITTPREH